MRKLMLSTVAALAAAIGGIAPAFAADYNYVGARYTFAGEVAGSDVTGFGFEASRVFGEWVFGRAAVDLYNVDTAGNTDTPLDVFSIGPGIRVPLSAGGFGLGLYGQLTYHRIALGAAVETSLGIAAGLTAQVTDRLQARAEITSVDGSDVDLETYELRVVFALNDRMGLTGSLLNGDISASGEELELDNLIRLGVRFMF